MAQKIRIRPGQFIGLQLTAEDREILLASARLPETLKQTIGQVPAGDQNVMFTLVQLSVLAAAIPVEISRTRDRRCQKKLDRIMERIQRLAQTFEER